MSYEVLCTMGSKQAFQHGTTTSPISGRTIDGSSEIRGWSRASPGDDQVSSPYNADRGHKVEVYFKYGEKKIHVGLIYK